MARKYLKKATLTSKSDASDVKQIVRGILDDIEAARKANKKDRHLLLRATLQHFVDTHPENRDPR